MNVGGKRDTISLVMVVAGAIGALSLAGIFVVYLVDTIGGDGSSSGSTSARGTTLQSGTSGPSASSDATPSKTPAPSSSTGSSATPAPAAGSNARINRIPDNQVYTTFTNKSAGYSILTPKGWTKGGSGNGIEFRLGLDNERIDIAQGQLLTPVVVGRILQANSSIRILKQPRFVKVGGVKAIKSTFRQLGVVAGVGKPANLIVDQYRLAKKGKVATIALGSPKGVLKYNADDYRKIIASFRWL